MSDSQAGIIIRPFSTVCTMIELIFYLYHIVSWIYGEGPEYMDTLYTLILYVPI